VKAQTRTEIASLLERHGISPVQRLGQHFLADGNITRKIVAAAGIGPGDRVVEIGAGTGTLTAALAGAGATVVAYEIDERLEPVLAEVTSGLDVEVRFTDITSVNLGQELGAGQWKMVANLPYNVGTPLVLDSMRHQPEVVSFVVMVQREVAERFAAAPGSKAYGLPSVVAQLHTSPHVAFRVPPQVFLPAPRVESAVVVMPRIAADPLAEPAIEVAGAAFGQRRKMLRRSLSNHIQDPNQVLEIAGVDPTLRAEDLSPGQYIDIARVLE
jgi:16S rRNA (adenine1518-N6/adenine1519-N6)-dimethyltransferase